MNFLADTLNAWLDDRLGQVEMSFLAKIVTFDKEKMQATIRPQLYSNVQDGVEDAKTVMNTPDVNNVPVEMIYAGDGCFIRPEYKKGDLVSVSCYASPIDEVVVGKARANSKKNRFSFSSCTVRFGVLQSGATVPTAFAAKSGLLIGRGANYIWFDGSSVRVEGDFTVNGDITADNVTATGDVVAGTVSLKLHVHSGVTTGPGMSGPPVGA